MICYRDKTYCTDAAWCTTEPCSRRLDEVAYDKACKAANFDWPVEYSSFAARCKEFKEKEHEPN